MSQGVTAGLAIVCSLDGGKQEAKLNDSIKTIEETRNNAYIQFHPDVKAGKQKLQSYWNEHQKAVVSQY